MRRRRRFLCHILGEGNEIDPLCLMELTEVASLVDSYDAVLIFLRIGQLFCIFHCFVYKVVAQSFRDAVVEGLRVHLGDLEVLFGRLVAWNSSN